MFKISPIQDKELQKKYADECGAQFCPELFAYSMINQESGELMGMSQFDVSGESGYIKTLKPKIGYSDFEAMFILGRATMNFIDLCGNHTCRAAHDAAEHLRYRDADISESEDTHHSYRQIYQLGGVGKEVEKNMSEEQQYYSYLAERIQKRSDTFQILHAGDNCYVSTFFLIRIIHNRDTHFSFFRQDEEFA